MREQLTVDQLCFLGHTSPLQLKEVKMWDFMAKVRKSKEEGDLYPLYLRLRHIFIPYIVRRDEKLL